MTMIDRVGRFRGRPVQGVIKPTKNGFPSFNVELEVTQMYDEDTEAWVDWSEFGQSITAYLCLFNNEKALLNYEQVMKAFEWDGIDMAALQTDDFGDLQISFEVEENDYKGKIRLQVNWVDTFDAEGHSGPLQPMVAGDLAALNAQYAPFMKQAPAAVPAKAPPKARKGGRPKGSKNKSKAAPPVAVAPPATAPPPPAPAPAPAEDGIASSLDRNGTWVAINDFGAGKVDGELINQAWLKGVAEVSASSQMTEDNFTGTEWEAVKATVLDILTV